MGNQLKIIDIEQITDNVFKLIDKDWMLITAGSAEDFNTMTASWGGLGILWKKPIAICFVRPQRYTYKFMENCKFFTLTFFQEKDRSILNFCGTKSGRDVDKVKATGLTPLFTERGGIYFEQARLVLECKKLYSDNIQPENFIYREIDKNIYPTKDYHRFYIGEIVSSLMVVE